MCEKSDCFKSLRLKLAKDDRKNCFKMGDFNLGNSEKNGERELSLAHTQF